jgi:hypothetical protein
MSIFPIAIIYKVVLPWSSCTKNPENCIEKPTITGYPTVQVQTDVRKK